MFETVFGKVILTAIVGVFALVVHSLNLRDRFKNWKNNKKKEKYKNNYLENNPSFNISLGYISNLPKGQCILNIRVLNLSGETKFIEWIAYNFVDENNPKKHQAPCHFANNEKWPKRLEHGEHFSISVPFHFILNNSIYSYWNKKIKVYATCHSTTHDLIRSNSIDYNILTDLLNPINPDYLIIAKKISNTKKISERNIIGSLWQLQIFGYLTSHIAKQFQQDGIPIVEFLVNNYNFEIVPDIWCNWQHDLNREKINENIIIQYLSSISD